MIVRGSGRPVLRLARLVVSALPAFLLVVVIRLLYPVVTIRIGALRTERIGHFVLETELMLLEQKLGVQPRPPRSFDVYYLPPPISNAQIGRMWRRVVRVWPRWLMVTAYRLNALLPRATRHSVPTASGIVYDIHFLLDRSTPLMRFSRRETFKGHELMDALGVRPFQYVCVLARDHSYHQVALPDVYLSYHDYRNWDINEYTAALEALADDGPMIVRMGAVVARPLQSDHPKIIDYARSGHRSAFADIWLAAHCKFCVSDGNGFYAVPTAFRRPNAFVNLAPMYGFPVTRRSDVGIPKLIEDAATGELVPLSLLKPLYAPGITGIRSRLQAAGLRHKNNSCDEVRDVLLEMNARMEGRWSEQPDDGVMQTAFWRNYWETLGQNEGHYTGHTGPEGYKVVNSRLGSEFLRSHSGLLLSR